MEIQQKATKVPLAKGERVDKDNPVKSLASVSQTSRVANQSRQALALKLEECMLGLENITY